MENNLSNHLAYLEAKGMAICWEEYANNFSSQTIECIGFNPNSGYVYIAMENGITIASMLGQSADYITIDKRGREVIKDATDRFWDKYKRNF